LQSALGQPLKAEIDVVALRKGETESLSARVASPEAFRQAGVDYGAAIASVRAGVQRRDGGYIVVLSSAEPINEPFLDVLVELTWATGRLVRQYTFLLDPAEYKGPREAPPVVAAPQVQPVAPPRAPEPVVVPEAPKAAAEPSKPIAAAPTSEPAAAPAAPEPSSAAAPAPAAAPAGSYEVQKGDTLSQIAIANMPAGVSLHQMLVALYRANEDAFIDRNMNLVRAGAVLKIPTQEEANAVAKEDATKVVVVQAQEFDEYRNRIAGAVAAAPAREEPGQRVTGKIAAAEPTPAAPKAPAQDQLRLSRAEEAAGKAAKSAARADDLAAKERALGEAKDRVAQLERNVKDMEKLLELKNQQLAQLQKQAEAAKAAPAPVPAPAKAAAPAKAPEPPKAAEPPPAVPAKAPEPVKAPEVAKAPEPVKAPEPPKAPEPAKAPEVAKAPEPAKAAEPPAAVAAAPATPPAAKAPAKPRPVAPPPMPVSEPSMVDELMDNPVALGGIGGVVLLLVGYGAYAYRKKKATSLENSLAGVTTTDSSSVFGTTGGRSVDTGGSSLQTDFSQSGIGAIDTDEVDPVAEADVYMAYGRDAQAEEILKEALQKDPSRQAVRVKLLEIYAARKDIKAFETTAGEIYAATGGQGPDWEKAAVLGQQVDPGNALYGGKRTEPGPVAAAAMARSQPTSVMTPAAAAALATPEVSSPRAAPPSIDFNLEAASHGRGAAPDIALDLSTPSQAPTEVGFDLDLGEPSQPSAQESDFSPSGTLIMDQSVTKAAQELSEGNVDLAIDFELPGGKTAPELDNTAKMMAQSQPTVVLPQSPVAKPAAPAAGMDFDFKLDEPTQAPRAAAADLSGISLDLGGGAPAQAAASGTPGWQEVATKLDLAKAYEEMGDKDGARELLNEVIKEGDNAQQQRARSMLEALR
jgi:pilus assembly protein FimV